MTSREICQQFANKHKLVFEDHGECGLGRPCVGFTKGECYVAFNPYRSNGTFEEIEELKDDNVANTAPKDAYHKHDCLAVLVRGDDYEEAVKQLAEWVRDMEAIGEVEIVQYHTGATGMQAMFSGVFGYAIRVKVSPDITVHAPSR